MKSRGFFIKHISIAVFSAVLVSFVAQSDSADSINADKNSDDAPVYIYLDYDFSRIGDGLLAQYEDARTRASVIEFFIDEIGDEEVTEALLHAAEKHRVDPALVVALSRQESGFQTTAVGRNLNKTTDRGLMQLNSATFFYLQEEEFFDPALNADLGVSYLKETMDLSGNVITALAMYNAGPGRVGRLGAPRSTLDYISGIMSRRSALINSYRDRYGANGVVMSRKVRPLKDPNLL